MAKRILDKRLKNELRNEGRKDRGIDVVGDRELRFETALHELQVVACDLQFFLQRDFVGAGRTERETEKIAELREHGVGGMNVFVHDGGNGVERVEKKVRLNLKAEVFELGLREFGLQLGGGKLLSLGDAEAFVEIVDDDDESVTDEVVRELHRITQAHDAVVIWTEAD